jgi:hypothetical protein
MTVEQDFPRPPGGKLVCEDGQSAVIRIKGGEITASCYSPDPGLTVRRGGQLTLEAQNWLLGIVKDEQRWLNAPLSFEDEQILERRIYEYRDRDGSRVRVEFSPPDTATRRGGGGMTMTG